MLATNLPPIPVSSKDGDALRNVELRAVAHIFSRVECEILQPLTTLSWTDMRWKNRQLPENEWVRFVQAHQDLRDVHAGKRQFSVYYLKDRALLPWWELVAEPSRYSRGLRRMLLRSSEERGQRVEEMALALPEALKEAARKNRLDVDTRKAIGDKYMVLDKFINHDCAKTYRMRRLVTW